MVAINQRKNAKVKYTSASGQNYMSFLGPDSVLEFVKWFKILASLWELLNTVRSISLFLFFFNYFSLLARYKCMFTN